MASLVTLDWDDSVALIRLSRPAKRNALNEALIAELLEIFSTLPLKAKAVVLYGEGDHFSAGLDLSDLQERDVVQGMLLSRSWHSGFEKIQYGRVPVIAALHGAVIGGGLELASTAHIRVADETAYFALPEGSRGIFVGGGGSVRIPRLIGVARMTDMMMTGRVYSAKQGVDAGFAQYLAAKGEALAKAIEIAKRCAQNSPITNYALMNVLPRIADQSIEQGLITESLMAAISQHAPETQQLLADFLEGRAAKIKPVEK